MGLMTWCAVHRADVTRRLAVLAIELQRRRIVREAAAERGRRFDAVLATAPQYLEVSTWER